MELSIANVLTAAFAVISFAFGYGILSQRVKSIEHKINEIDDLRDEVRKISDTLQKLVGQVEIFIKMNCKDNKHG